MENRRLQRRDVEIWHAQLGYGDGDEATIVSYGSNSSSKYVAAYLPQAIQCGGRINQIGSLTINLKRDDGRHSLYLNGTEVVRSNMPTGTITNTTFASTALGTRRSRRFIRLLSIRAGSSNRTNVIAVEIHQANRTSTDITL